jgi:molecular chaperone GrpE
MSSHEEQTDDINSAETDEKQSPDESVETSADEIVEGTVEEIKEVTVESLQAELEQAAEQALKFKDVALRAEAEMQNVQRRAIKDLEKAHKYGSEKLIQNLLPVIDSLEKAVESAETAADEAANNAVVEGVGLCLKMLTDVLGKEGVKTVDPMGEPFDPNHHQAMSMVENPDVEPNSVVAVIQKGYTLNERLVRPAMVMVSKAVSTPAEE